MLVTGGGAGIGRAIALGFAHQGAEVVIADWSATQAKEVVEEIRSTGGPLADAISVDVADYEALAAALAELPPARNEFDVLINNAGISPKHEGQAHRIWEMDPTEWNRVVGVNLTGTFNAIRLLAPGMRQRQKGAIVNMSSVAGRTYSPIVASHYAATKSAIIGFTKHLAAELGPYNVRVNAMAPGRIETPMVRGVDPAINDEQVRLTPMGRLGQPEEVADLALYLTSDQSSFVTGQTIDVAGGLYMT
ncbi:3-ketoacyl-(acyl-carrier-protein) reductase [Salinisphaera dokdonensis CL-ES53]|uniref:3-ketoacyl-(Acyl-carrier-protein) reductase n=1 Tax=Salinisphaera dokdonensis CL-ES53 TaxID=1304272 RepID=A0ABV2B2Z8_9GAMM